MVSDSELISMVRGRGHRGKATQRKKTGRIREQLLASPGVKRCMWCRTVLVRGTATVEHLVPISQGGLTNAANCRLACRPCNNGREQWTDDDPRKLRERRILEGLE